jgi:hypothetical protein
MINSELQYFQSKEWLSLEIDSTDTRPVLSGVWVTIDGIWIGDSIYWPLIHKIRNYKQL